MNLTTNTSMTAQAIHATSVANPEENVLALSIFLTFANIVATLGGTLGNVLVILVVLCNRSMHSSTNFFISSLASADLIVTSVCMPLFFVYNVLTWPVWPFGRTGCRVLSYLVHVSVTVSALSLLFISYDRFLSILFPFKRLVTLSRAKKAIGVIWLVSPLLLLPSLFHHEVVSSENGGKMAVMCVESWESSQQLHAYQMARVSCHFLFVLQITVLYCLIGRKVYKRTPPGIQTNQSRATTLPVKRRIIGMLFLVVLMFTFSWLPYIINKLLNIFPPEQSYKSPEVFVFTGNFLALLNSVTNPVVYAVFNANFRTGFAYAIRCKCNYDVEERRRKFNLMATKPIRDKIDNGVTSPNGGLRGYAKEHEEKDQVRCISFARIGPSFDSISTNGIRI